MLDRNPIRDGQYSADSVEPACVVRHPFRFWLFAVIGFAIIQALVTWGF